MFEVAETGGRAGMSEASGDRRGIKTNITVRRIFE